MATLFHGPKPEEKKPTFTITFEANGAAGAAPEAQTVRAETVITLPGEGALSFSGKLFTGWSVSPSGTGTTYTPGHLFTVSGNQTFYARWVNTGDVQQYTVTFNANGAAGGTPPAPQTVYGGISITIPDQGNLVNTGKNFTGWNTAVDGTGTNYNAGNTLAVSANLTLYAQWTDPTVQQYTVTYHANGASGSPPAAQTVNDGTGITLPGEGSLTNSGKTFNGWNTAANGSGTAYAEGADFTVNANTTFYAQWVSAPVVPPGATLAEQLAYIAGRADDGTEYDIVVEEDEVIEPQLVSTRGRNVVVTIHSPSADNIHTISLNVYGTAGPLFNVNGSITLKLQNITLRGRSSNTAAVINVTSQSNLVMDQGTTITGNENTVAVDNGTEGGGVYVEEGTFTMLGGVIFNNTTIDCGGGVYVKPKGTFNMHGGEISGNSAPSTEYGLRGVGGGIYLETDFYLGTVTTASVFNKTPLPGSSTSGIIYGSSAGDKRNTAGKGGAVLCKRVAVYSGRTIDFTVGEFDYLTSTNLDVGWGDTSVRW
jgi:hypothetical protein